MIGHRRAVSDNLKIKSEVFKRECLRCLVDTPLYNISQDIDLNIYEVANSLGGMISAEFMSNIYTSNYSFDVEFIRKEPKTIWDRIKLKLPNIVGRILKVEYVFIKSTKTVNLSKILRGDIDRGNVPFVRIDSIS